MSSALKDWSSVRRAKYVLSGLFIGFPLYSLITSHFLGDGIAWAAVMLPYIGLWLFWGVRLCTSVKCPVCGNTFYSRIVGNPFASKCMNCKSKIGS